MPMVHHIDDQIIIGNGYKIVTGSFKFDSGYSTTEYLNLVNYFPGSTYPLVQVSGSTGYVLQHDQGTASAGCIRAYQFVCNTDTMNGVDLNTPLFEVHTGKDMSAVNARFVAIGKSY